MVRDISERTVESESESDVPESEDGEGEVVALAKRCLELADSVHVAGASSDSQSDAIEKAA